MLRFRLWVSPVKRLTFQQRRVHHGDVSMTSPHYAASIPSLRLLSNCKNIDSLRKAHGILTGNGLMSDISCATKLVSLYGAFGCTKDARLVFDQIPKLDFYLRKVMLSCYHQNRETLRVVKFYSLMRKHCVDNIVFSIALKACTEMHDLGNGKKIHCDIVKARGCDDDIVLTGLVDMYAKCGEIESSCRVFEGIGSRNVVSWTSMIAGYVKNGLHEEGLGVFNQMRGDSVSGNEVTYGTLVTACGKLGALHQGKWLHGCLVKSGIELGSCLVTSLLDMYVKCGDVSNARRVFDDYSHVDLVMWTAMIVGYTHNGSASEALSLFRKMKVVGIKPNCVTIASVFSGCGLVGNLELGRLVHGLSIKAGLWDTNVANALVHMYAKCYQNREAMYVFEMESEKDLVAWNSIISGFSQNGSVQEALFLFHRMISESVTPNGVTVASLFSACASLGSLALGSSLHAYSLKLGFLASSSVHVGTALLDFYAKCGDAESARTVFNTIEEKNTITWSAMIGGYGKQGDREGSIELFEEMLKKEQKPNESTFTSILSACSHTGMVNEGKKYFNAMYKDYKFKPSTKHYTCMVDMLARAGELEQALDVIEKMPIQPDVRCFAAFLHGCGMHSRFDLGEIVIKKMLDLDPDDASYYVLVSNLYASDGRWSQAKEVRNLMKQRGLSKVAGHSTMETELSHSFSG
ncbi:Pentatricopeptide repeat-containing protein [Raphanus sativus]|uniref:Pentatricopeptide repeat-containing protein At2g03380, mitochondrial n=1 Tax=Raphanus sativus TaxID=3726 RepID=A0A9W3DMQ0_RAPSA|nr:pentatricopeptide repeat-containing protein At2g03380, mitochondrial [Raphanus sativus]KAJ4901195.1 Pentatricopeptide repeat-containing protein [Raphanus sativus]